MSKPIRLREAMRRLGMVWPCDNCGFHSPSSIRGWQSPFYAKRFCSKQCCTEYDKLKQETH